MDADGAEEAPKPAADDLELSEVRSETNQRF